MNCASGRPLSLRLHLLPLLACPECQGVLVITRGEPGSDDHVMEGTLACQSCRQQYVISGGIPRFLSGHLATNVRENVSNFGQQWKTYAKPLAENQAEFDSYMAGPGLLPADFKGKIVLDAGCGSGKFATIVEGFQPTALVALDLSDSVDVAFKVTRHCSNVLVVQGDLLRPPLRNNVFELVYSIGVLHHTADPPNSFQVLLSHLKEGGCFFFWLYAKEGNEFYLRWIDPIRRNITCHLPVSVNNLLAGFVATVTWPILLFYGWLNSWLAEQHWLRQRLPMFEYLLYFRHVGFHLWQNTILDKMIPHLSHHYHREELLTWVRDLELLNMTFRNKNSWGVLTRKPIHILH